MSASDPTSPAPYLPHQYWEERARRYALRGTGLAAVCSYGMPEFYNRMIHASQRRALEPWLSIAPGARVLDIGCGVGRWSCLLARRGAQVTGVDLSATMVQEAQRRAAAQGVAERCRFLRQDAAQLDAGAPFDLVLGVTVLQHILDADALRRAVERMRLHLSASGRMVLLEAAPTRSAPRCNSQVFHARHRRMYLELFRECGLRVQAVAGVDPAPFKLWLLPYLRDMPRMLAIPALAMVTAATTPIDLMFGRRAVERSWHAVFVLTPDCGGTRDG